MEEVKMEIVAHDETDEQILADLAKEQDEEESSGKSEAKNDQTMEEDKPDAGESEDEEDQNLDEEQPETGQDTNKPGKHMPIGKHLAYKKEWTRRENELLKELEDLKSKVSASTVDEEYKAKVQEYADEFGYDYETAEKQLSIFQTMLKPISEKLSAYDKLMEERRKEKEVEQQIPIFNADFDSTVLPLIKKEYPSATADQIEKIRQVIKDKAFGDDLNQKLNYIFYGNVNEINKIVKPKNRQSEGGRQIGRQDGNELDIENMSEEDALELSDEDFEKWSDYRASKSKKFNIYAPNGGKIN